MDLNQTYDVAVIGGGPGGVCAALAASGYGMNVLLVERYGFLGGMATAGLVNPFMAYSTAGKKLCSETFDQILQCLALENALDAEGCVFDDEVLKSVLDKMVLGQGIDLLLHTVFLDAQTSGDRIDSVRVYNKSGISRINARIFIDATGDGDLAASAGVPFEVGRPDDNACQPMTLCFKVAGVDPGLDALTLRDALSSILLEAKENGEVNQPREDVLVFETLEKGIFHFNTTRVIGKSGICGFDLTNAEVEGRRQAFEIFRLFKERFPGFSGASLIKTAAQIGVRETRRIRGLYVISGEDVLEGRKFHDGIARSCYPIDIHNPVGSGTVLRHLKDGEYYEISYRSIVPCRVENLLIGSRCISSTHEAHSSLRVMPVVAGIGEAAGVAASVAVSDEVLPADIDGEVLKEMILSEIPENLTLKEKRALF